MKLHILLRHSLSSSVSGAAGDYQVQLVQSPSRQSVVGLQTCSQRVSGS